MGWDVPMRVLVVVARLVVGGCGLGWTGGTGFGYVSSVQARVRGNLRKSRNDIESFDMASLRNAYRTEGVCME